MKTTLASAFLALTLGTTVPTFAAPGRPLRTTDPVAETTPFQSALRALPGGDRLEVAVSNPQGHKLTVRLLDEAGETLAIQFLGKQPETSRIRFDLSAVPSGTYRVEITSGSTRQVKEFTLTAPETVRVVEIG